MPRISEVAVALAAFSGAADAFWRMPCRGRTALGRIDPIMDFGTLATHSHTLQGGNAIGLSATSASMLADSDCTSCQIRQDKSAYWTPNVYFRHDSGEFESVTQAGGMLAYYLLYGDNIQPFPRGFQMISGDTHRRNFTAAVPEPPKSEWSGYELTQDALSQKAIGFNCLNYGAAAEPSLGRHFLPDKSFLDSNCPDGVRFEIMFPSCWNGKDVDSSNHKSHMAFPDAVMGGNCPSGFDTRVPSLFYETIWNTQDFAGKSGEFVISNGDVKGYGYHADFLEGWQDGFLEQAINTCTNLSGVVEDCDIFDIVSDNDMATCTANLPSLVTKEDALGPLMALPGNNPISRGPEPAGSGDSGSSHVASAVAGAVSGIQSGVSSLLGADKSSHKAAAQAADIPSSAAPAAASPACASRKTVVKGQEAWDICIEEEVVQITTGGAAQATGAAAAKRHLHHHAHKHHA